jgi:hypothetical protein
MGELLDVSFMASPHETFSEGLLTSTYCLQYVFLTVARNDRTVSYLILRIIQLFHFAVKCFSEVGPVRMMTSVFNPG